MSNSRTLLTTELHFCERQLVRKVRNLEERFYDEGNKQLLYFPARKAKYRGVNVFWYRITTSKSQASQRSFQRIRYDLHGSDSSLDLHICPLQQTQGI